MSKNKQKQAVSPEHEMGLTLDELVKRGARQVIQQAIESELAELLSSCSNVLTLQGKQAVVRNGFLPERYASGRSTCSGEPIYAAGLIGRSSSIRRMVQTGSFSRVSLSQADGSMPLSFAVANRL